MKKFTLKEYLKLLKDADLVASADLLGKEDVLVEDITYNSKEAAAGTFFICKGAAFKPAYLQMALDAGAVGYVSEVDYGVDAPHIIVKDVRVAMPAIADFFYQQIWKKLNLIGLTGTKGKSTTVYFIKAILDDYLIANGKHDSAVLSSIKT